MNKLYHFLFVAFLIGGMRTRAQEPVDSTGSKATNIESVQTDESGNKVYEIHHPNAAKGLIRIDEDKNYYYQIQTPERMRASSISLQFMSPPTIQSVVNGATISYQSMYKTDPLLGLVANYEWIPIRKFGSWGIIFESGISMAHGNGVVAENPPVPSQETFTLFVIPLTVMLKYRFEYVHKQLFVPFIEGGMTYYGLAELRSDNQLTTAGSPAVGGGGGIAINLTRGTSSLLSLSREYGISDMWLNLEGRSMAGLRDDLDFTNSSINLGVTVDY